MKKVFKTFFQSTLGQWLLAYIASFYIRLVYYTTKWQKINFDLPQSYLAANKPFITVFWHANLLMLPYAWPSLKPFHMLISYHHDGKLISKTVARFGIKTIFGSTNRGGVQALKNIFTLLKKGETIGVTPDGPRGPRHSVAKGLLHIAQKAKVDILPVSYITHRGKFFNSWDHFFLPYPFNKGLLAWGTPIKSPHQYDHQTLEDAIHNSMQHLDTMLREESGWSCSA